MQLKALLLTIAMPFLAFPAQSVATTIDGTANVYERPSLPLSKALQKAKEALQNDAGQYVCTEAHSKKLAFGGGWAFFLQSRTQNCRYVKIDRKGKVVANNEAHPPGWQLKAHPTFLVERAIAIAMRSPGKANGWFATYAAWTQDRDEWCVVLVNDSRDRVYVFIDMKGKTREEKVKR
jgi:hypothetical protein